MRLSPLALLLLLTSPALAQVGPEGIDWVTIGTPGNAPYALDPEGNGSATGRGGVAYEYRLGRTEITTAQYLEFLNAFSARADAPTFPLEPVTWGAQRDTSYSGPGRRYRLRDVPDAAMVPVGGISWRNAARMCNWLHNGKSADRSAIESGAYDTSTFGYSSPGVFTDQAAHSPGARYWIPTLDEWMKGAHYDPAKGGPGVGGWWTYANRRDTPLNYGPPGEGEANAGFELPNFAERLIPLGAYPDSLSPWGLLDTAGGVGEWTESIRNINNRTYRFVDGSSFGSSAGADSVFGIGDASPDGRFATYGLRIATSVPAPGTSLVLAPLLIRVSRRRRTTA